MHFARHGRYLQLESESEIAIREFSMSTRPPIMHAPMRSPEMTAPGFPKSIRNDAERLVIQAAREHVKTLVNDAGLGVAETTRRLVEAVRVLDTLEGKTG